MKSIFLIAAAAVLTFQANAQSEKYRLLKAELLNNGFKISIERYADLKPGEQAYEWKDFSKGLSYVIVACSDDNYVTDMDARLYDADGSLYQEDETDEPFVAIKVFPLYSRSMKIAIRNDVSDYPNYASRCRFIVAYK